MTGKTIAMDVLIADDDDISRELVKSALNRKGYHVIETDNGKKAWQLYLAKKPPIVITDWLIPKVDGSSLCQNIRKMSGECYTYIMVLTSEDRCNDFIQGFDAGADDYMRKPLNIDELTARIKSGKRIMEYKGQLYAMQSELEAKNRHLQRALYDMKNAQARMITTEKMAAIGRLSSGLTHEINNPIGFIDGNLKVLAGYVEDMAKLIPPYHQLIQSLKSEGIISRRLKKQLDRIIETQEQLETNYLTEQVPLILKGLTEQVEEVSSIIKKMRHLTNSSPSDAGKIFMGNKENGI